MSLWKIAWRSIQQRALASTLTGFSMALGVTMVVAVLVIHGAMVDAFQSNRGLGYNLVVGAKGGKLQLVLNTVYYLSAPVENIPYSFYKRFTSGDFKEYTEVAVPVCLGDYYRNYRVIGTTPAMFDSLTYGNGSKYTFAEGRNYRPDEFYSAVIGATVARDAKLKVGSKFQPTHGAPDGHEHEAFTVVGVLARSGTPNDRALFVNMEGFYLLENHAKPVPAAAAESSQYGDGEKEHAHDHEDSGKEPGHEDAHEHADGEAEHEHAKEKAASHALKHAGKDEDHAAEKKSDEGHKHGEEAEDDHKHSGEDAEHEHPAAASKADHGGKDGSSSHGAHDEQAEHNAHDHSHGGHDHAHEHKPLPEEQREVTAILVRTLHDAYAIGLRQAVNEGPVGQAVLPIAEMTSLFDIFVTPLQTVLLSLTVLIVIVSGIGILVSIYNSMSERRHEIAVMRALGAGRSTVMLIVLLESILLSLAGGLFGWILGHTLIAALNPWIVERTGVAVGMFEFVPYELVIIPGLILLASLVGYLPAMAAYRTDVAKALSAAP